jgi:glycerate kinase
MDRPLVVAAPDKFRGTATAHEVGGAMGRAAEAAGYEAAVHPMADGGEGTLDALGGPNRTTTVTGPLGDPVEAAWQLRRGRAVIEVAQAVGLHLVGGPEGNDAVAASTHGVGELISEAVEAGARRVLITLGGSATTDGGLGALRACSPLPRFRGVELLVACDVRTRFTDAAEVFGPQKGATSRQVELLRRRLDRLADVYETEHGVGVRDLAGAGAAGGLAGGLAAMGATLVEGFQLVVDELELDEIVERSTLLITGEGHLDVESFAGKVVGGLAALGESAGVPVLAVVGDREGGIDLPRGLEVISLVERVGRERAMADTLAAVEEVVAGHLADRGSD